MPVVDTLPENSITSGNEGDTTETVTGTECSKETLERYRCSPTVSMVWQAPKKVTVPAGSEWSIDAKAVLLPTSSRKKKPPTPLIVSIAGPSTNDLKTIELRLLASMDTSAIKEAASVASTALPPRSAKVSVPSERGPPMVTVPCTWLGPRHVVVRELSNVYVPEAK